jgi:hypothetical protein
VYGPLVGPREDRSGIIGSDIPDDATRQRLVWGTKAKPSALAWAGGFADVYAVPRHRIEKDRDPRWIGHPSTGTNQPRASFQK